MRTVLLVLVLAPALLLNVHLSAQAADGSRNSEPLPRAVIKPPKPVSTPTPLYPKTAKNQTAKNQRVTGVVIVEVVVGVDGSVHDPKIVRSLSPELDAETVKTVGQWKFKPATKDGKPVAVKMNIEVSFHEGQ